MSNVLRIYKDFGCVPCGQKIVKTFKIENQTKKPQELTVLQKYWPEELLTGKLKVCPKTTVVEPKQIVSFKLTYLSGVEGIIDNFYYDIVDAEELVAHLYVHAQSVGPCVTPKVINVKFFFFSDVNQTIKNIELTNTSAHDARFNFDFDDECNQLEVSQTNGVIPAGLKLGLKLSFRPLEQGVFYKKVFCTVQFHEPLVLNVLAVYKPKFKLDPKSLTFRYPPERSFSSGYDPYMNDENLEKVPEILDGEKCKCLRKSLEDLESNDITSVEESEETKPNGMPSTEPDQSTRNVYLTKNYIDICNSTEVLTATALVNLSRSVIYYFQWDQDPRGNFVINPCRGLVQPNSKIDFTIYFCPSVMDRLYYIEFDLRVFKCNEEYEGNSKQTIDLPLTMRLKLIGHSFKEGSCGWVPQCKVTPKVVYLSSCVPGEVIYGTFRMEREGHLPVNFVIVPPKDKGFTVQPPLGHLSGDFQIFVVQFESGTKVPGIYTEDLIIKLNHLNLNTETIRIVTTVELPRVIMGTDNSITFPAILPGSQISKTVVIANPTNLFLSYEFIIPEDITWLSIPNPKGSIEPKSFDQTEIVFKPKTPCEYLACLPCLVSSVSKPDATETDQLQLIGSCQYGYLVVSLTPTITLATPSIHNFGECVYKNKMPLTVHLFNFSSVLLFFRLNVVDMNFTKGDSERDVKIFPNRGEVPPKGSLDFQVIISPHEIDNFKYDIECQNYRDNSRYAKPCGNPRKIVTLTFEGVLPTIQIVDLKIMGENPLFSQHWLWKMFSVEEINKALKSLEPKQTIDIQIPEAIKDSPPTTVAFVITTNQYGQVAWEVKSEIKCPCYEASSENVTKKCLHTKAIILHPLKQKQDPSEKVLVLLKINYDFSDKCIITMTISMSDNRQVQLNMLLLALNVPTGNFASISCYLGPKFNLRPVLIGDPQPPVQLFWLYNNSNFPAAYSVNMGELRKLSPEKVFDCVNPEGIIQPFSSHPLGIIFSPNELITYSVNLIMNTNEENVIHILLEGEGVLNVQQLLKLKIPATVYQAPCVIEPVVQIDCSESIINIDFIRVFSTTKRVFFLKNKSTSDTWSFSWRSSSFENLFSVTLQPERGVIKPNENTLITLVLKSFCYPMFISFSIPCEVCNYSQKKAHEEGILLAKLLEEREKEYFTITDKGTEYTKTEFVQTPEPKPSFVFITLNANIIGNLNIDQKLNPTQQSTLRAEKEIQRELTSNSPLKPVMLQDLQICLENILWDVLCSRGVTEKMENLYKSQDFFYHQLSLQSRKKKEEFARSLKCLPDKHFLQRILDNTVKDIVCKNFTSKNQ